MSSEATPSDVKMLMIAEGVVEPDDFGDLTSNQVQWHIENYARMLIERERIDSDPRVTDKNLVMLEACLAGHSLLSSGMDQVRQKSSEMLSDNSQAVYAGEYGVGLRSTSLGQKAVDELDPTNRLASISKPGQEEFWSVTLTE